jgi:hypothetical protein
MDWRLDLFTTCILVSRIWSIRIWAGTSSAILTEIYHSSPQSLQTNADILQQTDHERFLPNPCPIHQSSFRHQRRCKIRHKKLLSSKIRTSSVWGGGWGWSVDGPKPSAHHTPHRQTGATSETAAPEVATSDRQQLAGRSSPRHTHTHLTQLINRYGPDDGVLHAKASQGDDYMAIPAVTPPSTRNKTVISLFFLFGARGSVVAWGTMLYKPESRGFETLRCHWIFQLT